MVIKLNSHFLRAIEVGFKTLTMSNVWTLSMKFLTFPFLSEKKKILKNLVYYIIKKF